MDKGKFQSRMERKPAVRTPAVMAARQAIDPRDRLRALRDQHGIGFARMSQLLGRNAAYIQQFVERGTPKKLDEEDRIVLGRFFGVAADEFAPPALRGDFLGRMEYKSAAASAERLANQPPLAAPLRTGILTIPRFDIRASAGPGALTGDEGRSGSVGFDAAWLRTLGANPDMLSIIRVDGDSMQPSLCDGDDLLVDRALDGLIPRARPKGSIFVLRMDDVLMVKRVVPAPGLYDAGASARLDIVSDNPAYPTLQDVDAAQVQLIGRVVWYGRQII